MSLFQKYLIFTTLMLFLDLILNPKSVSIINQTPILYVWMMDEKVLRNYYKRISCSVTMKTDDLLTYCDTWSNKVELDKSIKELIKSTGYYLKEEQASTATTSIRDIDFTTWDNSFMKYYNDTIKCSIKCILYHLLVIANWISTVDMSYISMTFN